MKTSLTQFLATITKSVEELTYSDTATEQDVLENTLEALLIYAAQNFQDPEKQFAVALKAAQQSAEMALDLVGV